MHVSQAVVCLAKYTAPTATMVGTPMVNVIVQICTAQSEISLSKSRSVETNHLCKFWGLYRTCLHTLGVLVYGVCSCDL